jgi:hypothetical protein
VIDPEAPSRALPGQPEPTGMPAGPHALQILSSEHWSLLSARSLGYTEAMSRTSIFVAALSGAVVALALVAQATDFGTGFVAFALVLLPVVCFLGWSTVARLAQINAEDARWVQGMNRIRHAYLELAPELEPYFVTSAFDDESGIRLSAMAMRRPFPVLQPLIAVPGVVALIDSVVAGATLGILALGLDLGLAGALVLGCLGFLAAFALFVVWARRWIGRFEDDQVVRFPSPASAAQGVPRPRP